MTEEFDKKYGFDSDDKQVQDLHKKRRMFAIVNNELKIAPENSTLSHAEWFENEGWISQNDDSNMQTIIRGFVDREGIYFYVGYDFSVNEEITQTFFKFLSDLKLKLNLSDDLNVYGGMIKQSKPGKFPPKVKYGKLTDLLEEKT